MRQNAIEVKELRKSFKDHEVLKGVNFSVNPGEIFALLGSNGAGKTTTIRILSTLSTIDSGNVSICGYDVNQDASKVKELISLTGQFAAVDDVLTGKENLMLIAKLRHIKNPKEIVEELLINFDLVEAANRKAATYSGGMRRRLDIAMSLIGNPKVIFLDEPTTGLDPEVRLEVWNKIKNLSSNGITVFLTTQYLEEAEQLANRIAILHEGKIIANGTLDELKKLFPPTKIEYIEKQPSLEEIFLSIIRKGDKKK